MNPPPCTPSEAGERARGVATVVHALNDEMDLIGQQERRWQRRDLPHVTTAAGGAR